MRAATPRVLAAASLPSALAGGPVYPLYAIDSVNPTSLTQQDCHVIATNFSHIQAWYKENALECLAAANPDFRGPVKYLNSDVALVEEVDSTPDAMLGVSYYTYGNLRVAMSQSSANVLIDVISGRSLIPSNPTYKARVRVGDEVMEVTGSDGEGAVLTVTRGCCGTTPVPHAVNATVFLPVYNAGGYPGHGAYPLRYCVDPATTFGTSRMINHTIAAVGMGFAGSWFDCLSAYQYNSVDVAGVPLKGRGEWDFARGRQYTIDAFIDAQRRRITAVFAAAEAALGRYPVLLANNLAATYWPDDGTHGTSPWNGDARSLLEAGAPGLPRPLDGYSLENFAGSEPALNGQKEAGCDGRGYRLQWQDVEQWERNVNIVADAASRGLSVFPMMANAGCRSSMLEIADPDLRDAFEAFSYASFLLGVSREHPQAARLGVLAMYRDPASGQRRARLHPRFFWPVGLPAEDSATGVAGFRRPGHASFARRFANGIVVVNPTNATDRGLALNATYVDPAAPSPGRAVTTLDVEPQRGYILLRAAVDAHTVA